MDSFKKVLEKFKNQKVGILGLGEENIALIDFLIKAGIKVVICDQKTKDELGDYYKKVKNWPVQFRLGPHYLDNLKDFKIVFRSPGIPYLNPKIQAAKIAGVEISSQTKLFFELCPCPIIGVTGTKGKGTTASLIYDILMRKSEILNPKFQTRLAFGEPRRANSKLKILNSKIYLGGNIGNPPIEFLEKLTKNDIVILELSSFQLQDLDCSPHIAVVLDIKIDHLDYHRDEKEYIEAKRNLVRFQTKKDFAAINADYFTSIEFASLTKGKVYWFSRRKSVDQGTFWQDKNLILRINDQDISIIKADQIKLLGEHNLENAAAAALAGFLAAAEINTIKNAIIDFKGLKHRLEFIRVLDGVSFYNDSYSTTPETTIAAIRSFKQPIILLVGGSDKRADYNFLIQEIEKSSVRIVINIGQTGKKIIEKITLPNIEIFNKIHTLEQAVNLAVQKSKKGEVILLSPASASFDQFQNYQQRGEIFKSLVNKL
ncbi:MAG: UDP-N-acetylmuramoyl-L-alanine--D-glutamate ligase [Patescibacteria group bacterium]